MPPSRRLVLAIPLLSLPIAASAQVFQLVTPEEAQAGRGPEQPRPVVRRLRIADPPLIEVVEPREATLSSPLTIRLRFRSPHGTAINPASFRASYGALDLDITERMVQHASVDASGMALENVAIPAGSHLITVRVADADGSIGERTLRFTVTPR